MSSIEYLGGYSGPVQIRFPLRLFDTAIGFEKYEMLYVEWIGYPPDAFSKYISDPERPNAMDRRIPTWRTGRILSNDMYRPICAGCVAIVRMWNRIASVLLVESPFRS